VHEHIHYRENEKRYVEVSALPIMDKGGQIVQVVHTARDITERKLAEQERLALQEQVRQSQKMEAIGLLAGGIAHDFNNILTVISGSTQLAMMDLEEGDPLRANLEEIKKASDRAADLTRQLLAFSRKQILEMKVLDLNEVLQRLNKMLRRVIGEDTGLEMIASEPLGKVRVDPGQMEQVIMNLVVNARDAMPGGGKLILETANAELDEGYARMHIGVKPGSYVMLSVNDTGAGMTQEVKERIFEPFFTTKEMGKGTGLGLSTVYGIVKQSGGNIWVYSEPGKGTTFKIYLPRVDEPLEERKEREIQEVPMGSETVLVVEDEEAVRKLAARLLKKQGYKVLEAPDGGQAIILCEKYHEPIHLILSDVVMPGMSGRRLAEQLKEIHPEVKVLYMSGYTDNAILHHGVLEPGINFLQKPFTVDGLARKVREALDK
jgi:signal transduction histidine kinase/ActR/RegA family two-component response regulator